MEEKSQRRYSWTTPPQDIADVPILVTRLRYTTALMLVGLRTANERGNPDGILFKEYQEVRAQVRFLRAWQARQRDLRLEELVNEWDSCQEVYEDSCISNETQVFRRLCDFFAKKCEETESHEVLLKLADAISKVQKIVIHRIKPLLEKRAWLKGLDFEFSRRHINRESEVAQQRLKKIRSATNVKRHVLLAKK